MTPLRSAHQNVLMEYLWRYLDKSDEHPANHGMCYLKCLSAIRIKPTALPIIPSSNTSHQRFADDTWSDELDFSVNQLSDPAVSPGTSQARRTYSPWTSVAHVMGTLSVMVCLRAVVNKSSTKYREIRFE